MLGIDYSLARPGGAAIKAAGYGFVCRYLASYAPKRLTVSERDDLLANGLTIAVVFEDYANPKQNYTGDATATGIRDAQIALSQANSLGVPSDRPIYFAVDYDAPESDQPWIDAYLRACASVLGANRVGIYGGFYVVKRCAQNGTAKWFWQTVAWSGGQQYPGNHIYQNGQSSFGGGADIDESKQSDFGQWPIKGVQPVSKLDLSIARVLAYGILGRNGTPSAYGQQNALDGESDSDLNASHVGQETNGEVWAMYQSPEGQDWKNNRLPALVAKAAKADQLQKDLDAANAKLATQGNDPNNITITPKGWTALWTTIKGFFSKNN